MPTTAIIQCAHLLATLNAYTLPGTIVTLSSKKLSTVLRAVQVVMMADHAVHCEASVLESALKTLARV